MSFEDAEKAVYKYFIDIGTRNILVSRPMLQAKAKDFTFLLGSENVPANDGWPRSFKGRYNIVRKATSGQCEDRNGERIS